MSILAATATGQSAAAALLVLFLIVVTLGYVFACWCWPFVACRRCDGTGRQLRPGRRALNYLRAVRANDRSNRRGGTR